MKRRDVRLSKRARRDIEDIYDRVVEVTASPTVAERYRERLLAACERIGDAAEAGRPRDDILPGIRSFAFERRLIILYLVLPRRVRIARIFDGRRDYVPLLTGRD